MIRVALVRGKYLNNFEGQNYRFDKKKVALVGIASRFPLDAKVDFPVNQLSSFADIPTRVVKIISNRTIGDSQILFGLKNYADEFDIFHAADPHYYYSYQLARLRQKKLIKKLLLTSWETIPFNNETVYRRRFVKRFTMKHADHFLCYTEKAQLCLIKEGVKKEKITLIKLGIDLERFKYKKRDEKMLTILFVGRLVDEKGILDVYQAFKNIRRGKLRIIGQGPLEKELKRRIRNDNLESQVAIEKRDYRQMPGAYQAADIFIMPSKKSKTWEEQYGMVLIEAMASGLPIVAYKTGAIPENLGNTGILVRENDIAGLTKQTLRLLQNRKLRLKLGKMGRKRAQELFDSRKTAHKIQAFYEALNSNSD